MARLARIGGLLVAGGLALAAQPVPALAPKVDRGTFLAEQEAWRQDRLARLTKPEGWLSVVGLEWLAQGENVVGSGDGVRLHLPAKAPARVGVFTWRDGKVSFKAEPGVVPMQAGKPFTEGELQPDASPMIAIGDLRMTIIQRGPKMGLRVRDTKAEAFSEFKGIPAFRPDPAWRLEARFEAYPEPREMMVPSVIGIPTQEKVPGKAIFTVKGRTYSLEPVIEDDHLFFIFRDATAGHETYGAVRFLYTAMPKDGKVVLDFNRAENPPCAFTAYATCPLPPKGNILALAIRAGEKDPHLH
ncbi:MAG TPA: DUF1684 domain-containing protein [Holophagaceae bacterium]|nr:DUF1684 domain-containing protein [Holophagaceae bacterium]